MQISNILAQLLEAQARSYADACSTFEKKQISKSQGDESRRSLDISSPQGSSKRKIENGFTVRLMYKESQESLSFCMILNLTIEP